MTTIGDCKEDYENVVKQVLEIRSAKSKIKNKVISYQRALKIRS